MIDFTRERPLSIKAAADFVGVSESVVRRWINVGHRGRRLEAERIGGVIRTSVEAISRFSQSIDDRCEVEVDPHYEEVALALKNEFGINI